MWRAPQSSLGSCGRPHPLSPPAHPNPALLPPDSLRLSLSASHASQLASSAASDSSSVSSRASSRSVEGDLVSVSSRESAEYPKITRTCIEGLVDGLDHERQKRWLRRQQAAYLRAKREAERKLKMENPTAEFVYGGPYGQTLMVKK
jgi:hypothetical protein